MRDPNLVGSSIAVNTNANGYYISWVRPDPWLKSLASMHGVQAMGVRDCSAYPHAGIELFTVVISGQVNGQGGDSISWRKHGFTYGWKLSLLLGSWVEVKDLPAPLPDTSDASTEPQVREMVRALTLPS